MLILAGAGGHTHDVVFIDRRFAHKIRRDRYNEQLTTLMLPILPPFHRQACLCGQPLLALYAPLPPHRPRHPRYLLLPHPPSSDTPRATYGQTNMSTFSSSCTRTTFLWQNVHVLTVFAQAWQYRWLHGLSRP